MYLPNGNPVASPNFDYKLRWFDRFIEHAPELASSREPAVLAGDLNVVPTDYDIYNPWRWRFDAVMQPQSRDAFRRLTGQGWTDAVRSLHPESRMYSYWTSEAAFKQGRGFRLDFVLLNAAASPRLREAGVDADIVDANGRATLRRYGKDDAFPGIDECSGEATSERLPSRLELPQRNS